MRVTIDGEAVADSIDSHMAWNTTKSEDWEHFIVIIWLDNLANVEDSSLILVVLAEEVE